MVLERGVVLAVRGPDSQLVPTLCLFALLFWFPHPQWQAPLEAPHTRLGKVPGLWISVLLFLQTCKVEDIIPCISCFCCFCCYCFNLDSKEPRGGEGEGRGKTTEKRKGGGRGEMEEGGGTEIIPYKGVPEITLVRIKKEMIHFIRYILCKILALFSYLWK